MRKSINNNILIVFVKNAELGYVKTRLAKTVGDENALVIYRALVDKTKSIIDEVPVQKAIYYAQYIDEYDQFPEDQYAKRLQMGDSLGERMKNAFEAAFNKGFKKAVIIGSDCWDLSPAVIEDAFLALDDKDFVLGPAEDGGYYLMGMKELLPEVFENKTWSTADVLIDTLLDIDNAGKSRLLLPVLSDIDHEQDLPETLKNLIR